LRTIAVIALKGGSGKTTVAMQMALAAHWRGHDVMVVDIDPQHSAHDILSAREEPGPGCVVSTGPKLLSAKFAAMGLNKDLLFVDTPAGAIEEVTEAIVLADYVILIVRPTLLDIRCDPEVPPIPPHATYDQIKETASAVLKGDANAWHLMYQGAKTKAQEFVPHRDS